MSESDNPAREQDNPYPGWGRSLRQNVFTLANRTWRGARLNKAADAVLSRLPPPAKRWVDDRRTALRVWAGWTVLPAEELERTYRECLALLERRLGRDELGDYLEFGVFYGTSLLRMQRASADAGLARIRLVGFDSFEGLPESADVEGEGVWRAGEFHASFGGARRYLTSRGADWNRITLVPGWYDDTLTPDTAERLGLRKASVIMVDCDLYSSTVPCLRFAADPGRGCDPLRRLAHRRARKAQPRGAPCVRGVPRSHTRPRGRGRARALQRRVGCLPCAAAPGVSGPTYTLSSHCVTHTRGNSE